MIEFIFMLTRDDVTLANAREVHASVAGIGLRHVGCKDVGLPEEELAELMDAIRADGAETYLEVVSETDEATLESARAAARIRPDHLIGGTLVEPASPSTTETSPTEPSGPCIARRSSPTTGSSTSAATSRRARGRPRSRSTG